MLSRTTVVAASVGVAALGVRLPGALNHSLWGDEIASARVLVQPKLSGVLLQVRLRESTPPGWYVLSWLVHRGGVPLQDLRLLSVLASALLAALVVVDADRLMPLWAAALAGLAVALGFQFVAHGTEMRAYALFALLAVLFAVALEAAASEPTRRRLLLFGACVAAGMLTHYFFFLTLVTGIAWLWSTPWPREARIRVTTTVLVALVPFLLWLPSFREQLSSARTDWIDRFDPLKVAYLYSAFFANVGLLYHRTMTVSDLRSTGLLRLTFFLLVVLASIAIARRSPGGALCAALATGPVALAAVASLAGARVFDVRNLLAAAPFTAIAVAYVVSRVPRPLVAVTALILVAAGVLSFLQVRNVEPLPYGEVARALVSQGWHPHDPIVLFGAVSPFPRPHEYVVAPLGWYLPGHARLVLTGPSVRSCRHIYVVAATPAGHRFLSAASADSATIRGSVAVARVPAGVAVATELVRRGGHFLRPRLHRECLGARHV